jgi:hypothetical protein
MMLLAGEVECNKVFRRDAIGNDSRRAPSAKTAARADCSGAVD